VGWGDFFLPRYPTTHVHSRRQPLFMRVLFFHLPWKVPRPRLSSADSVFKCCRHASSQPLMPHQPPTDLKYSMTGNRFFFSAMSKTPVASGKPDSSPRGKGYLETGVPIPSPPLNPQSFQVTISLLEPLLFKNANLLVIAPLFSRDPRQTIVGPPQTIVSSPASSIAPATHGFDPPMSLDLPTPVLSVC